jgi:hypothetical protein
MGVVEINKIATNVWRVRDSTQKINEEKSKFNAVLSTFSYNNRKIN